MKIFLKTSLFSFCQKIHPHIYVYKYISIHTCIYIYIRQEREGGSDRIDTYTDRNVHRHTYIQINKTVGWWVGRLVGVLCFLVYQLLWVIQYQILFFMICKRIVYG